MSDTITEPDKAVHRKYVSRKINSIRWKPSKSLSERSNIFISGSWDDEVIIITIVIFIGSKDLHVTDF